MNVYELEVHGCVFVCSIVVVDLCKCINTCKEDHPLTDLSANGQILFTKSTHKHNFTISHVKIPIGSQPFQQNTQSVQAFRPSPSPFIPNSAASPRVRLRCCRCCRW